MRKNYAAKLTKEFLIECGVTDVTPDARVFIRNVEHKAYQNGKYKSIVLYSPKLRQSIPKEERTNASGQIVIPLHVVNYVWHNNIRPEGMIVDHIDNNQDNNHIDNLQLLTPQENLKKNKDENYGTGNNTIKLSLSLTEEEILEKINYYIGLYEKAKEEHNAKAAHKYRTFISQWRGRFKKFKEFQKTDEYKLLMAIKEAEKDLEETKKEFRNWKMNVLEAQNKWQETKNVDDKYSYKLAREVLTQLKAKVNTKKIYLEELKKEQN